MEFMDLIDELEDAIESGGKVPLTGKRTIDMGSVGDILDRIRAAVPQEIYSAHEIRARSEGIVTEAVMAARQIKAAAEKERQTSVEESSVLQAAHERGNEIIAKAEEDAAALRRQGDQAAAKRIQEADTYAETALMKLGTHVSEIRAEAAALETAIAELEKAIDLGLRLLQTGRAHTNKNGNGTKLTNGAVSAEHMVPGGAKIDGLVTTPLAELGVDDNTGPIDVDAIVAAAREKAAKRG